MHFWGGGDAGDCLPYLLPGVSLETVELIVGVDPMKPKRVKRYSKVQKAVAYIRDIGRGYVRVYDPESLRQAAFTVSNYLEILELNASETDRRSATHEAESIVATDAAKREAALTGQITLFESEGIEHEHEPPT